MRVLNTEQMRDADRRTIDEIGIPAIVLMENAGRQAVAAMEAAFEDLSSSRVGVICGRGNNGGDGFVVARTLVQRGVDTAVFLLGSVAEVRGEARTNLEILGRIGMTVVEITNAQEWELHFSELSECQLVVDAILGTGFRGKLNGFLETVVADLNALGVPIIAIDLPTGVSADSPFVEGPAVEASMTVTLAAPKIPLVFPPADTHAGDLVIADIGIPLPLIDELEGQHLELLTRDEMREIVPTRTPDSHKGDFGRVLIVAGSTGRTGAAHLSALGALRSGAGLVTVATPRSCLPIVASMGPEYMTEPLEETASGTVDFAAIDRVLDLNADVIAVGPGLGQSPGTAAFVHALVERSGVPLVLDADALNAFAGDPDRLVGREEVAVIITPHPGEMARLLNTSIEAVQQDRLRHAREFARSHRVHVILKGHRTIVAAPDGRTFVNLTGNPGMATGGTGDLLTGMLAAWFAQLLDAEAACKLAVYLHGTAGDLAEADEGDVALVAGDLAARLGDAVLELTARRTSAGHEGKKRDS
ncbi:MAG TPA: NAD(P)H-hydrate dehydratase [Vicinamibacterales bacterium]|jgi:NAD(P)H-hydrate epimerase